MKIKNTILIITILTSIILLGLFVNNTHSKKVELKKQNNSQTNLQPDCIIINKLNSKAVDQSISDQTIKEYFTQGLEYYDKMPLEDKKFAINNLYPETNFEKNFLQIYTKALECKDKRIAKLLFELDLTGGNAKAEWFDQNFEITWSKLAGKKIEPKGCNFDYSGGPNYYYFELDQKVYTLEVYRYFNSVITRAGVVRELNDIYEPKCK